METELLEQAFYEKTKKLTEAEATERAKLFYTCIKLTDESLEDYWVGLSDNWDLNIWESETEIGLDIYPVENENTITWKNHIRIMSEPKNVLLTPTS